MVDKELLCCVISSMRWIESDLADKETIDIIMVDINTTIYLLWASAESWLQK